MSDNNSSFRSFENNSPPSEVNGVKFCDSTPQLLKCSSCNKEKHEELFDRNRGKKTGRDSRCKSCVSVSKAKRYKKIKREQKTRKRRRSKTRTLDLSETKFSTSYLPFEKNESEERLLKQIIDTILWNREQLK